MQTFKSKDHADQPVPTSDIGAQTQQDTAPSVAIVVLMWNDWRETLECLESLQRLNYPNYRIVVVDNGSSNDAIPRLEAWARGDLPVSSPFIAGEAPKPVEITSYAQNQAAAGGNAEVEDRLTSLSPSGHLVLVNNLENLGCGPGNNSGIRYALARGYTHVMLLANDLTLEPNCIQMLVSDIENDQGLAAVSPKVLYKHDQERIWWIGGSLKNLKWQRSMVLPGQGELDGPQWGGTIGTDMFAACAGLVRAEAFRNVGLFDEDFFFGWEDVALSIAMKNHGYRMAVCRDTRAHHRLAASERLTGTSARLYYVYKYRLLLLKRYGTLPEKLIGFPWSLLKWFGMMPLSFRAKYRQRMLAYGRGLRDFLTGRIGMHDQRKANDR